VAHLSLGSSQSTAVNAAVAGAVNKGLTMVVAAGNNKLNACNYSPASEPTATTVGATTSSDARASYSNYGSCVDIFAPGSAITSAWIGSSTATNTISGTSMASPHVAGIAALALEANPSATPAAVAGFLMSNATANRLSSLGTGSPNLLAFSLASGAPGVVMAQTVVIKSLAGSSQKSGKTTWLARVTATVRDVNSTAPVANALVSGSFSSGGSASCLTGSTGSCTLSSASLANTVTVTSFTVSGVAGSGLVYDANQNAASQLSITKP
jgi:subtilisin family serine protease